MDVSFLENKPYFHKNYLQGENEVGNNNFWDLSHVSLPNTILTSLGSFESIKQNQENSVQNNESNRIPGQTMSSTIVSSTGGETLQTDQRNPNIELLIYTKKKTHQSSQDPILIQGPNQSKSPKNDTQISIGISALTPNTIPLLVDPF